jgi:arylsulfatase A-like enzyme
LGNPGSEGQPDKMGFGHWYGYLDQVHAHDHYTDHLWEDGSMVDIPENRDGKKGVYVHDLFEEKTMAFIQHNKAKPFFLYLAYTLPHGKYEIPEDDPSYILYNDKPWTQQVKNYAAMITKADATVGKMMELLKQLNIDDKTIVFYTSDNGPNRPFVKPLNSAGGLKGIKRSLYEGGIRAGMVVRWPEIIPEGKVSDFQWGMQDVFPTLCDIAQADMPENLDGISVLPTLKGNKQKDRDHLYWEYYSPFQQAVRMGDWKGIRFGTKEEIELYDLSKDWSESQNIALDHPKVVKEMNKIMNTSRSESPFWPVLETRKKK